MLIDELKELFIQAFPKLDITGQQQAAQLYQLLSQGQPVNIETFARKINLNTDITRKLLDSWTGVSFDTKHQIDAFWGLSTSKTTHSFNTGQHILYTWCAWDLLFMPVILKQTITATTQCPLSKQKITLTISEQGIEEVNPANAMVTFIKPTLEQLKANVTSSFCQYIFFVESEQTGQQWQQQHDNGFLLELDQGFKLGKDIIQQVFKDLY